MKIILNFLLFIGIIFISGCASEPQTGCTSKQAWYQAGISADQTRRDLGACQYEAMLYERRTSIQADTVGQTMLLGMMASSAESSRESEMIQACMTAKGYSLVSINSPLLADRINSIEDLKAKAESGDVQAQFNLGSDYANGNGVGKNWGEAAGWYRKAAEQNDAKAQFALGNCYHFGLGVLKDEVEACKWYSLAAAQGNENAKANLGVIKFFENADDVPQLDPTVNAKLLGHWTLIPSPENPIRGQWDIYFLTNNRCKNITHFLDKNGQPLPTSQEDGRYYFTGNQLYTCGDKDKEGSAPEYFSVTNTKLTLQEEQWKLVFEKQMQ